MNKIPRHSIDEELVAADIWDDEWEDLYWEDYWDGVHDGEMSWQWYMKLKQHQDWHHVIINKNHKNITVANWIKQEYPGTNFNYEREHFIIDVEQVAIITALKWS